MNSIALRLGSIAAACIAICAHAAEPVVVKIGHVAALSGPAAHLGRDNENGVRMAIEELNAKGVQIAGRTARFELVAEDDAGDPKQGTAAAQKLVDMKVAGVVGHLNSGTAIPAARLYSDAGIVQIAPSVTNPRYTRLGYQTAFRMVADDAQLGGTLGRYAVQTLKAKTVAVIDDRIAYGQGVASEFEKAAKAAGATILKREFTTDKATDFTGILTGIRMRWPARCCARCGTIAFDERGDIRNGALTLYSYKANQREELGVVR